MIQTSCRDLSLAFWLAFTLLATRWSMGIAGFASTNKSNKKWTNNHWNQSPSSSTTSTKHFAARGKLYLRDDTFEDNKNKNNNNNGHNLRKETENNRPVRPFTYTDPESERPTETLAAQPEAAIMPPKPKIVVLGATGKVGRLVIRQLLESSELQAGATVVAFCRDYDKACRVLYDDLVVANNQRRGPKLQIIQGDLLSKDEVCSAPSKTNSNDDDDDDDDNVDESEWLQRAKSAAAFYGTAVSSYNDGKTSSDNDDDDGNQALRDAIAGCSAIISCVGSVRPTNAWTDFVVRPLIRLLRKDVSGWCSDARHPYYTTYISTKKAVEFAEEEQKRRQVAFEAHNKGNGSEEGQTEEYSQQPGPPRIRFVRISDLALEQKPWHLVPLVANVLHSMVFRYQDMAEQVLEESKLLDTVVIRPGDLVDDERPDNVTIQVQASNCMDQPAVVGREDVAALAVATTLLPSRRFLHSKTNKPLQQQQQPRKSPKAAESSKTQALLRRRKKTSPLLDNSSSPPFHCTVGVRWTGDADAMSPYPAQGCASDGQREASLGFRKALQADRKAHENSKIVKLKLAPPTRTTTNAKNTNLVPNAFPFRTSVSSLKKRKLKPYGVCVAVPVYFMLALLATSVLQNAVGALAGAGIATKTLAPFVQQQQRLAQLVPQPPWTWMVSRCSNWFTLVWSTIGRYVPQWGYYPTKTSGAAKFLSI
ncbi:hypothetical protein ACA910_021922 [Epithemia clementina (nom. ined.)]